MRTKLLVALACISLASLLKAQNSALRINPNINLPKDSLLRTRLIGSIQNFLDYSQQDDRENGPILKSEYIETTLLLDELKGIERSSKYKDEHFYKPYLNNVLLQKDSSYLIEISYIGIKDSLSFLRISYAILAHPVQDSFLFSSLLKTNTHDWKTYVLGRHTFHYRQSIHKQKVKEYVNLANQFDFKLFATHKLSEYYCCANLRELQGLLGISYKSDYNGSNESVWGSTLGDKKLIVWGNANAEFTNFDPHDLFHSRLSMVISRSKVNKPVDEGCAYLYGGSWGLSWKEILDAFKQQIAADKNTNWLALKENPVYFKTKGYNNSADYIVNALLVQKIEKEKGFIGVWELLMVGPAEKGNEKYFATLEKLTGINKENYNQKVWELIENAH